MPFGLMTRVGPRNLEAIKHVLCGLHTGVTSPGEYYWTVHVRRRCGLFVKLLWPLVIIRPHARIAPTTYVDAAYCYRPSSVVCRLICHTSEPCKNGWTDVDAVWVEDSGGPREPCIRWGPDPPWEGAMRGKMAPIVKYSDFLPWAVQKLSQSICHLGCGLRWAEGSTTSIVFARWRQCALIGGTLVQPGEYDSTSICSGDAAFLSSYFDHLLLLLLIHIQCTHTHVVLTAILQVIMA